MDSNTADQPPPKKRMHGALKFFLLAIAGGMFSMCVLPCVLGAVQSETKTWNLSQQYEFAFKLFIIGGAASMVLSLLVMVFKKWGVAGFLFGFSMAMIFSLALAWMMREFDGSKYRYYPPRTETPKAE